MHTHVNTLLAIYIVYINVDATAMLLYIISLCFHAFRHACAKTGRSKLRVCGCNRWECNSFYNITKHLHNICFFISLF